MKRSVLTSLLGLLFVGVGGQVAQAKNIDLVTLPGRDKVQLTIYNSEDITLVKETRSLTFKKGANQIQFSWANTLIDPTSLRFRPLEHVADIDVADAVISGQKPQALIWNIDSKFEGQVAVEISYFTSGLSWSMDYTAVTDADEKVMAFRGYVRVFNNSGEEYEDAEVRLIVGTINLAEKIAELARRYGMAQPPEKDSYGYRRLGQEAARDMEAKAVQRKSPEEPLSEAKHIVKEGLSEYFLFSVSGTETIRNGWSKRMEAVKADNVKFDIVYRMRTHQYGPQPVRFFIWRNDPEHKLGDSPLPDGLIRVFRDTGKDGLSYLGQQLVRYVPIKAEIEVNLGTDDLVVYESLMVSTKRLNFHFQWNGNQEYVDGWDEQQQWIDTIRNYRTKPIVLEMRRVWPGDVEYTSEVVTTAFDYQTVETKFTVDARGKKQYPSDVMIHNGVNAKQSRVELKAPK